MAHIFFGIGLSLMLTHEMDAIKSAEWRIFPGTSLLDDRTGHIVFTTVHVPLCVLLLWNLYGLDGLNRGLMIGLEIFFIVHVFLHLLFLRHPKNQFASALSWAIIVGSGAFGALALAAGS